MDLLEALVLIVGSLAVVLATWLLGDVIVAVYVRRRGRRQ